MLKRFFSEAGIDTSDRKITNHSARVTLCTTLYNKQFPDKAVVSRSKHRSNAVQAYQREQFDILNDISGALEPDLKKNTTPETTVPTLSENATRRASETVSCASEVIPPVKIERICKMTIIRYCQEADKTPKTIHW